MTPDTKEARTYIVDSKLIPLKYQQITSLGTAVGLEPPQHARIALIQAVAQSVRWRDDGTNPTATVGMQLEAGRDILYTGDLTKLKLIEEAASAEVNILYYF